MTNNDLTVALGQALTQKKEGFTVQELCEQAGLNTTDRQKVKIRQFLKSEIEAGRVTTRMGRRTDISGRSSAIPIYLPMPAKGVKK